MTEQYTTIPAGYRLIITSWENDGDNYHTGMQHGLSRGELDFHLALCKLLTSRHNPKNEDYGNLVDYDGSFEAAVWHVMCKYESLLPESIKLPDEDGINKDQYPDWFTYAYEIILQSYFGTSEYYFTRVFESCKIEYLPDEIKIQDVTSAITGQDKIDQAKRKPRFMFVGGKVSDMCMIEITTEGGTVVKEHHGYVPRNLGIGGGDYIRLNIDLETGQIVDWQRPFDSHLADFINGEKE